MMDFAQGFGAFSSSSSQQQQHMESIDVVGGWAREAEREHMFDKVVTPSDVGKLNRLVIPKQHAEKYFPLDDDDNNKDKQVGVFLNFEDRQGKSWRFRYSYWNSSQSYVMTKGWSRFVKDKNLNAGDLVSFLRHPNSSSFFIDWRRRPHPLPPDHHHHHSAPWTPLLTHYPPHHHWITTAPQLLTNYNNYLRNHHQYGRRPEENNNNNNNMELSVPTVQSGAGTARKKKLRLFGVNMEMDQSTSSSSNHDKGKPQSSNSNSNFMSLHFHM